MVYDGLLLNEAVHIRDVARASGCQLLVERLLKVIGVFIAVRLHLSALLKYRFVLCSLLPCELVNFSIQVQWETFTVLAIFME